MVYNARDWFLFQPDSVANNVEEDSDSDVQEVEPELPDYLYLEDFETQPLQGVNVAEVPNKNILHGEGVGQQVQELPVGLRLVPTQQLLQSHPIVSCLS